MRASALDRFVGIPYCPRSMDCGDLVMQVQREIYGRTVCLPGARPRPLRAAEQALAIRAQVEALARRVAEPADGDLILMFDGAQDIPGHAGTFFFLAHEPWVLHTSHVLGGSRLHRLSALPSMGLQIEGYYRWSD